MKNGEPQIPEGLDCTAALTEALKAAILYLKEKHEILSPSYDKSVIFLLSTSRKGRDEVYAAFARVFKNGLKSRGGLTHLKIQSIEVPDEYKILSFREAVAYELTAQVQPKYEKDGKAREVTLRVVLRLSGRGGCGKFELFVKDSAARETHDTVAEEVRVGRQAARRRYREVLQIEQD